MLFSPSTRRIRTRYSVHWCVSFLCSSSNRSQWWTLQTITDSILAPFAAFFHFHSRDHILHDVGGSRLRGWIVKEGNTWQPMGSCRNKSRHTKLWQVRYRFWVVHGRRKYHLCAHNYPTWMLSQFAGHAVIPSLARDMKDPSRFNTMVNWAFVRTFTFPSSLLKRYVGSSYIYLCSHRLCRLSHVWQ